MPKYVPKGGSAEKAPRYVPDWSAIEQGIPFSTRGLKPEQMTRLKRPLVVHSRGEGLAMLEKHGHKLYPNGNYEFRVDGSGKLTICHMQWHRRAKMWQYRRDALQESAKQSFMNDDDGRLEQGYGKGSADD